MLQVTFFAGIKVGYVQIDVMTPFIIWWATRTPLPEGIIPVIVAAVLADNLSALPAGIFIFAWSIAYLTTRYIMKNLEETEFWQQASLSGFITMETIFILQASSGAVDLFWPWGLGQAVLNSLTGPFFFKLFDSFTNWGKNTEMPENNKLKDNLSS